MRSSVGGLVMRVGWGGSTMEAGNYSKEAEGTRRKEGECPQVGSFIPHCMVLQPGCRVGWNRYRYARMRSPGGPRLVVQSDGVF